MRTAILCQILSLAVLGSIGGCSFHARDADSYRKVTRELVETRSADIKACYDAQLKDDRSAQGKVVVRFTVQAETGTVTDARVDEDASSAPASLGQCVVKALDGLTLDPPDARKGDATFTWAFEVKG
ncbi:MAG: AgmX/PglI C-terminal domain-containing protein [Myxococcales bacterium]|nr:AgmX/PglI C-terminal domain-containing protein [Myxococcales bacterium]